MTHAFCHVLPKVELHAHLNTSFTKDTLKTLVGRKAIHNPEFENFKVMFEDNDINPIDESFNVFSLMHKICDDEYAIYKLTYDMIHEFVNENVKYLEIRSTPKDIPSTGLTRELYVDAMLRAIRDCKAERLDIIVRVLLSIDRRHGLQVADLTVDLADTYKRSSEGVVVGVDFSGDPAVGDATDFIPVFEKAQSKGLKLALHLAETKQNHKETLNVLKYGPCDRIGHGTFLHLVDPGNGYEEIEKLVLQKGIPVEACMTSNIKCQTVKDYESHHFNFWWQRNHPVVICTDGIGVYQTTLTNEYVQAARAYNLSNQRLWDITLDSLNYIFASTEVKDYLKLCWNKTKKKMQSSL